MFAGESIGPPGGVSEVGQGKVTSHSEIERARLPLEYRDMQPNGNFRPRTQIPVEKAGNQRASQSDVSIGTMFGNVLRTVRAVLQGPEPTRKDNILAPYERVTFLSGMPANLDVPETIGLTFEPAGDDGIYFGEAGLKDLRSADDMGPQDVENTPKDGLTDNLSVQVQDWDTNAHDQLKTFRASYPSATVKQAPAFARSVVLQQVSGAGDFRGELILPDQAVTVRLAWSAHNLVDLWACFSGDASIPDAATQAAGGGGVVQSAVQNDGTILNPDTRVDYLVKGKRAISFRASGATTVNAIVYMQS
jgi:hypothetical protein